MLGPVDWLAPSTEAEDEDVAPGLVVLTLGLGTVRGGEEVGRERFNTVV